MVANARRSRSSDKAKLQQTVRELLGLQRTGVRGHGWARNAAAGARDWYLSLFRKWKAIFNATVRILRVKMAARKAGAGRLPKRHIAERYALLKHNRPRQETEKWRAAILLSLGNTTKSGKGVEFWWMSRGWKYRFRLHQKMSKCFVEILQ